MKRHLLVLLLGGLAWLPAIGQPVIYNLETRPCPFDPTVLVSQPKGWLIYQTIDGTWDGPVDSSRCLSAVVSPFASQLIRVDLLPADFSKPIFVRAKLADFPQVDVPENRLYNMDNTFLVPHYMGWKSGSDCPQGICTGMVAGLAIPTPDFSDPTGATRFQTALTDPPVPPMPPTASIYGFSGACVPSEYFAGTQFLRELILKFTLEYDSASTEPPYLDIAQPTWGDNQSFNDISFLQPFKVKTWHEAGGQFYIPLDSVVAPGPFWGGTAVAAYGASTYPSAADEYYIEAEPEPNTPDPKTINLQANWAHTLVFQPFVQLRGGLVAGGDSVRHTVNLVNNGASFCLNFVDLIFEGGDRYIHNGGDLDMNNSFSCMQFRRGSALRVGTGQTLHYGSNGSGMLALCSGGSLELEPGASLMVDCILNLSECNNDLPPQQIYMDLLPGTRLAFTENARLTNRFSLGQQMKLNVRMLGGTLDDALLTPEDRAVINRIWPAPAPDFSENVSLAPNPFSENVGVQLNAAAAGLVRLRLTDVGGRVIFDQTEPAAEGINEWELPAPVGLAAGAYFFIAEMSGQRATRLLVKADR
jgi:hypothetical protein